jgi:hypothetical protein
VPSALIAQVLGSIVSEKSMLAPDKLKRKDIERIIAYKPPGLYRDGGNLLAQVTPRGSASWVFILRYRGRQRGMGLGPLSLVDAAAARKRRDELRRQVHEGADPLTAHKRARAKNLRAASKFVGGDAESQSPMAIAQLRRTLLDSTRGLARVTAFLCSPFWSMSSRVQCCRLGRRHECT